MNRVLNKTPEGSGQNTAGMRVVGSPPALDELPEVLSVRHHIAPFLGVSENLVYAAIRQGSIPSVRIGRRIIVSKRLFLQWLEGSVDSLVHGGGGFCG